MSWGHRVTAALAAAVIAALALALPAAAGPGGKPGRGGEGRHCLDPSRVAAARHYANHRAGVVSFAVLDECGRLVGDHRYRVHLSASVVKVMLIDGLPAPPRRPA